MHKLLAKLPAFVLPFVTRSLRGGRGRRYALFSLMIAAATMLIGFWLALGRGSFEQEVRVELRLEQSEWQRQQREFVVFAHGEFDHQYLLEQQQKLRRRGLGAENVYGEVVNVSHEGLSLIQQVARAEAWTEEDRALRDRARALVGYNAAYDFRDDYFEWNDPEQRARVVRVLDLEGIPEVRRYTSPLGLRDALTIIGFLAGGILAVCVTVFGPLLVAIQQAQERHENTLTPLTGTALDPRELSLGLASGPMSVVAIFAAPQLLLFGGCALLVGHALIALMLIGSLAATGLFLTFAAQLLGQLVGHRRTPGIVAIALMAVLGIAWLTGIAFLHESDSAIAGFPAVLPTFGLATLLAHSFGDLGLFRPHFDTQLVATLVWSVAALVFAGLALTALARKIAARPGPLLEAPATLLGALTCIVLIHVALLEVDEEGLRLYLGLAALALPFSLLLMARVPIGDEPPRMRRVPAPRLLAEFAAWQVAHIIVACGFERHAEGILHPIALLYLGWCVVVLGLIAIRLVSYPARLLDHLFLGFCGASLLMGFIQAVYWSLERHPEVEDVFALSRVSPVLGLVQVAVTVAVPIVLARSLSKNLGSIT